LLSVPGSQIPAYVHVLSHGMHKCQSNCRDDSETKPLGAVKKKNILFSSSLCHCLISLVNSWRDMQITCVYLYIYIMHITCLQKCHHLCFQSIALSNSKDLHNIQVITTYRL
jgi:hypothetical protein